MNLGNRLWQAPYLLLTLTALMWSGNFVAGRALGPDVPPITLAYFRWVGSLLCLLPFTWQRLRQEWSQLQGSWPLLWFMSSLGISGFNTCIYIGLKSTTAINALLMQSAIPVLTVLFSFLLLGIKASFRQLLGVLFSMGGVCAIALAGQTEGGLRFSQGDLWVIAAVLMYAVYTPLLSKRPAVHPLTFLSILLILGTVLLTPFFVWEFASGKRYPFHGEAIGALAFIVLFPGLFANFFFNRGVELAGGNKSSLFIHLMPVFGTLLAFLFLDERLQWVHGVGIALIALGLRLATRQRSTSAAQAKVR